VVKGGERKEMDGTHAWVVVVIRHIKVIFLIIDGPQLALQDNMTIFFLWL